MPDSQYSIWILCGVPPPSSFLKNHIRYPHPSMNEHLNTISYAVSSPWFWIAFSVPTLVKIIHHLLPDAWGRWDTIHLKRGGTGVLYFLRISLLFFSSAKNLTQRLGSVQVLRQRFWGGGSEPKCWCFGGGWWGLSQNADMLTLWRERVGELKHRASICHQIQ